jgi:hypothetical protein
MRLQEQLDQTVGMRFACPVIASYVTAAPTPFAFFVELLIGGDLMRSRKLTTSMMSQPVMHLNMSNPFMFPLLRRRQRKS